MKKLLALFLALTVVLCGCSKDSNAGETTSTTQTEPSTKPTSGPSTPNNQEFHGYDPDSNMESATGGAVKVFSLEDEEYYGMIPMSEGLLLFSGEEDTQLTYLDAQGGMKTRKLEGQYLFPEDVVPFDDGVAYYDMDQRAVIILDLKLDEQGRIDLPESITGEPAVTADRSKVYYFTENALRCLDVETGIDRLLKEISFYMQDVEALHFGDTLLECLVFDEHTVQCMMFSAENGELLYASDILPDVDTFQDRYFALHYDSGVAQYLFGTRQGQTQCLSVEEPVYLRSSQMMAAVTGRETDTGVVMDYYDLEQGTRSSTVELPIPCVPNCLTADPQRNAIWFITLNEDFESELCRWDVEQSLTGDTTTYVTPYYTVQDPDVEGLERIEDWADALGREHGIRIRVFEAALRVQPFDYEFEVQHLVPVYEKYLAELEEALEKYPSGFLKKLGKTSDNGKLTLSLVRAAYGSNNLGSLESADGVHFYNDGDVYIALVTGENFQGTLYHELFHAIDTYVMTQCNIYDDWDELNPPDFAYDNDYVANQFREDDQYLEDDRWFIDMYSMSYAKEDRARIMEYAMQSGNGDYFASKHLQAKLQLLCKGIRKAFGLQNASEHFVWEQYLK